uniref:Probable nicotinate-nucleotide adenylyltransferase n=1 Tax=Geobacter sp. (strain M21) TaxID=443144 RepID=NADD_GEOSM|nr:RecName: Full=Probable nicotinate-nucleotide adenylyltransferase; AltName: Full=Deamido-NAD(+) diphosphorylase; AltName: Full=Deamido-NAD(+) pyrophosphorylase; AltName: Full=Nicotinate mononucleotide adenylyltransferase; Short=NaMN adenylyltransferase [Geobacter sp. M21]
MRLGILGGTFNPIHNAHLRIAEEARDLYELDRVVFIPAATPPHKPLVGELSFASRLEMVRLAVADNSGFMVSDMEGVRGGRSYSIDTLRELKAEHPDDELFFIVGADSFNDISTWKEYAAIFGLCNVISVQRPGSTITSLAEVLPVAIAGEFCYDPAANRLNHCSGHAVYALDGVLLDISSSHIRLLVQGGRSIRYLIPDAVEQYIKEQRLYVDAR